MVNFELGKEVRKMFFRLVTSVGQRKNSESPEAQIRIRNPSEVEFLMGTQNFSFVPRSWQDEKTSFLIIDFIKLIYTLMYLKYQEWPGN